jgi:hypothetical protein
MVRVSGAEPGTSTRGLTSVALRTSGITGPAPVTEKSSASA